MLLLLNEALGVRMRMMMRMGSKQRHNWNLVLSEWLPVMSSGTGLEPDWNRLTSELHSNSHTISVVFVPRKVKLCTSQAPPPETVPLYLNTRLPADQQRDTAWETPHGGDSSGQPLNSPKLWMCACVDELKSTSCPGPSDSPPQRDILFWRGSGGSRRVLPAALSPRCHHLVVCSSDHFLF